MGGYEELSMCAMSMPAEAVKPATSPSKTRHQLSLATEGEGAANARNPQ